MFYIWVQYDKQGEYEPHMTFKKSDKDDADFEIQDLKDHRHCAKYGKEFPQPSHHCELADMYSADNINSGGLI